MERLLQITADGSHTIAIPTMQVSYHSKHGAIQESNYVFINAGLKYYNSLHPHNSIRILEIGFGTGLNCLLAAIYAREQQVHIQYHAVESFPLPKTETDALNYGILLNEDELFQQIHRSKWGQPNTLNTCFDVYKYHTAIQQFAGNGLFDCIFFDAFAPSVQPELWSEELFAHIFLLMKPGAVLVTYCSKSIVRHAMQAAGLRVTKIQGPYGKREMVRAFKDA